jgi:hypothetical protein
MLYIDDMSVFQMMMMMFEVNKNMVQLLASVGTVNHVSVETNLICWPGTTMK